MSDDTPRTLSRSEFLDSMVPSFAAMLANMTKGAKQDPRVLAACVYDQLALCGVELHQRSPREAHGMGMMRSPERR